MMHDGCEMVGAVESIELSMVLSDEPFENEDE